jgi:hypothetical protein
VEEAERRLRSDDIVTTVIKLSFDGMGLLKFTHYNIKF